MPDDSNNLNIRVGAMAPDASTSPVGHTAGPWRIITEDHDISVQGGGWFDGQDVSGWIIVGNPDDASMAVAVIDTAGQNVWDDDRLDANARLIAAAPELLEACESALMQLRVAVIANSGGLFDHDNVHEHIGVAKIMAAIANARGTTPAPEVSHVG